MVLVAACGIFAAQAIASSRSSAVKMKYPPSCSLVSANGPSKMIEPLLLWQTVVAVVDGFK